MEGDDGCCTPPVLRKVFNRNDLPVKSSFGWAWRFSCCSAASGQWIRKAFVCGHLRFVLPFYCRAVRGLRSANEFEDVKDRPARSLERRAYGELLTSL